MTRTHRSPMILAGLALGVCLSASGCDEPATHTPRSGLWTYSEVTIASNSCDAAFTPDPIREFIIDYDEGDEFQIELGAQDASCEIDGTEFYCADYELSREPAQDLADATIVSSVRWEGTLTSDSEGEGREIYSIECFGEDCTVLADLDLVPCEREAEFTMQFVM